MKTPSPLTTEELIAQAERVSDKALSYISEAAGNAAEDGSDRAVELMPVAIAITSVACELRALRLMLRDEIREAAWRMMSPQEKDATYGGFEPLRAPHGGALKGGADA